MGRVAVHDDLPVPDQHRHDRRRETLQPAQRVAHETQHDGRMPRIDEILTMVTADDTHHQARNLLVKSDHVGNGQVTA